MRFFLCFTFLIVSTCMAIASTILVPSQQPTIQDGINAAANYDTVLVAPGIYTGIGNRDIDTQSKQLLIKSESGADITIVDIESNSYNGFNFSFTGEMNTVVLDGFTIRNAVWGIDAQSAGYQVLNCVLEYNQNGIRIAAGYNGGLEIVNTTIKNNSNYGIYMDILMSSLTVSSCQIDYNNGYGIHSAESSIPSICHVENSIFEGNATALWGSFNADNIEIKNGLNGIGGHRVSYGAHHTLSDCTLENLSGTVIESAGMTELDNCTIRSNSGGVASVGVDRRLYMTNCDIYENIGIGIAGEYYGEYPATISLSYCSYYNNASPISLTGMSSLSGTLNLDQCTIVYNNSDGAYAYSAAGLNINITNTLVAFNTGYGLDLNLNASVLCCDVYDNTSGNYNRISDQTGINNNISADPIFCSPGSHNYYLAQASLCTSSNSPCGLIGKYDEGCLSPLKQYLPGDANMYAGQWEPMVIGADVTYLVNYFRALSMPCIIDDFYASGDANGDCLVIGSDVTYLVNYFRGLNPLNFCPDYSPAWPPLPSTAPSGWPNCE